MNSPMKKIVQLDQGNCWIKEYTKDKQCRNSFSINRCMKGLQNDVDEENGG